MTPDDLDALRRDLIRDEGLRLKPYRCAAGKLTIGVGRNLDDKGITSDEAMALLDDDITECLTDLATFDWFGSLTPDQRRGILNMRFQLGHAGFRGFTHMLHALAARDYRTAGRYARASKWWRDDTPERAERVIRLIEGQP